MKIRTDFVTNSSSSSFIIARKEELTEQQKEVITNYVIDEMLGKKIASTKEELEKYIAEDGCYLDDEAIDEMKESIDKGLSIYTGRVDFEEMYDMVHLLKDLWKVLESADTERFVGIETSLEY